MNLWKKYYILELRIDESNIDGNGIMKCYNIEDGSRKIRAKEYEMVEEVLTLVL